MNKNVIKPVILILMVSVASGFLFNLISNDRIPFIYRPIEIKAGMELDHEQTYRLLREGRALFIDTRYEKDFHPAHISGAVNIPGNLPRDELTTRLKQISKDTIILIYCSSSSCPSARRLAGFMTYLGYENVALYPAGFEEWLQFNYPVEKD